MHWFKKDWWKYLLTRPAEGTSLLKAFICRARNHPAGVIWYNPSGLEPDMHCQNCRDHLG